MTRIVISFSQITVVELPYFLIAFLHLFLKTVQIQIVT